MRWYHYTGLNKFKKILADEALLSFYQKMREDFKGNLEEVEKQIQAHRELDGEKEYQRNNYIFLTPKNDHPVGTYNDVVLGFELDQEPNFQAILILPKVSLDNLVDVGARKIHLPFVRGILRIIYNRRYSDIPTYTF